MNRIEQLIEACLNNDRKAQFALYDLFFQPLMRIAGRYKNNQEDAAALVNETFFKAFTQIQTYKRDVPFEYWIKRIALNTVIDDFRKYKKIKELQTTVDFAEFGKEGMIPEKVFNLAEKQLFEKDILQLIDRLDESEKVVFNLFELDGVPHKEIAELLGVSERSTNRYLSDARLKLRDMVTRMLEAEKIVS